MGGLVSTNTSNDTNNKSQPVTNRKQSSSLEQKINQYAADLILRSNFRDMQSLMKKEECDKLVILTSKVIDQHFHKADINMFNSKLNDGDDSVFSEPIEYIKETKLQRETENMQKEKTKLCQGLARYYIKIAHLFAAITQTVNPTYIYDVAEPKNKYATRYQPNTYLPSYSPLRKNDKQYGGLYTDYLQGSDSVSKARSPIQTKQKLKLKWDELRELNNYEYIELKLRSHSEQVHYLICKYIPGLENVQLNSEEYFQTAPYVREIANLTLKSCTDVKLQRPQRSTLPFRTWY